jgi:hypothetical protein
MRGVRRAGRQLLQHLEVSPAPGEQSLPPPLRAQARAVPIKIWLVSMHKGRTLRETPLSLLTSLLRVGCSLVQLTSGTEAARAQTPDDSAAVAGVVEHYHSALAKGDGAAALGHLAEDAVVVESGIIESREEYRSHHLPAEIGFTRAVKEIRSPVRVKIQGDVAWATATAGPGVPITGDV